MAYKAPVNYRSAASRTPSPEAIAIDASGLALLAEAPADPTQLAMAVTVGGASRTRVTGAPSAGQYRVLTQTVLDGQGNPHTEYLPILQFNAADANLAGTCDYYRTGTVLTDVFFATLISFLTPLVLADVGSLPAPTSDATQRGRPGDVAVAGGYLYFSDGVIWTQIAGGGGGGNAWSGSMSLAATMALALDAGYTGGGSGSGSLAIAQAFALAQDGVWAPPADQYGDLTLHAVLAMSMDAVAVGPDLTGDIAFALTAAIAFDATYGITWSGAVSDAYTFGLDLDASWNSGQTYNGNGYPVPNNPNFATTITATSYTAWRDWWWLAELGSGGAHGDAATHTENQTAGFLDGGATREDLHAAGGYWYDDQTYTDNYYSGSAELLVRFQPEDFGTGSVLAFDYGYTAYANTASLVVLVWAMDASNAQIGKLIQYRLMNNTYFIAGTEGVDLYTPWVSSNDAPGSVSLNTKRSFSRDIKADIIAAGITWASVVKVQFAICAKAYSGDGAITAVLNNFHHP